MTANLKPQKHVHTAKGGNYQLLSLPAVFLYQFPLRRAVFSPTYEHSIRLQQGVKVVALLGGDAEGRLSVAARPQLLWPPR